VAAATQPTKHLQDGACHGPVRGEDGSGGIIGLEANVDGTSVGVFRAQCKSLIITQGDVLCEYTILCHCDCDCGCNGIGMDGRDGLLG